MKILDDAREDGDIAAVVLRVDSPGGSAVASEEILHAISRVQAEDIPVVISMGSTAASGGYYIACKADAILADASTITASIGVLGGKIATEDLWKTLGISWHSWKRGANADLLDFVHPFSPEQRSKMESWMGDTYGAFKAHVQEGRGAKLTKPLEEMAGGRVFTGAQAVELGLVDQIGGLRDAIAKAAELANLRDGEYSLRVLPEPGTFWESFFMALRGEESDASDLSARIVPALGRVSLGALQPRNDAVNSVPALLQTLAPAESKAMARALAAAKLIGEERVIVLMPELSLGR
jgi:protease-4